MSGTHVGEKDLSLSVFKSARMSDAAYRFKRLKTPRRMFAQKGMGVRCHEMMGRKVLSDRAKENFVVTNIYVCSYIIATL